MASKYGYTVDVILYDMTLQDINRLDTAQMRDALKVLNDAANKRAKRLEEQGLTSSFAYQHALPEGAEQLRFTTPKTTDPTQSRNVLYKQLTKTQEFLRSETSTISKRTRTIIDPSTGEARKVQTNAGWKPTVSTIKEAMQGEDGKVSDEQFAKALKDSDFWRFVRELSDNYGYDSTNAISYATVYSKNYNSYDKIQRAMSYLTGAEVDTDSIAQTRQSELWGTIFAMSNGSKENFATKDGYADEDDTGDNWDDEDFDNPWRYN